MLRRRVEEGLEIAFCRDYLKLEMNEADRLKLQIRNTLSINLGNVTM